MADTRIKSETGSKTPADGTFGPTRDRRWADDAVRNRSILSIAGRSCLVAAGCAAAVAYASPAMPAAAEPVLGQSASFEGLPEGTGRDDVLRACSVCHPLAIVTQQRRPPDVWAKILGWMTEEQKIQKMNPLSPGERQRILDYLATHFGREDGAR